MIKAAGLTAHERVLLQLRSVDAQGTPWVAEAAFRADASGRLDLDYAAALSGSYTGVWGMGLIAMMQPTKPPPAPAYFWGQGFREFDLSVFVHERRLAATTFRRRFSAYALRREHERLAERGFIGDYWAPAVRGKRPAIVAFGGSEGGEGPYLLGALLAAHGYPTLVLAYFDEPGLPPTLSHIPLEYFARALRWLRHQPRVDPNRILTLGMSRGSEAALLLGVHYPSLVRGVIASVPSDAVNCGSPCSSGAAWTLHGKPLPYTRQFGNAQPTDEPAAVIHVERIDGPIFLACAGLDRVWGSCAYARAIMRRLNAHHDRHLHLLYRSPRAGHLVGSFIPYEPGFTLDLVNERARERLWPHLLSFLARQ